MNFKPKTVMASIGGLAAKMTIMAGLLSVMSCNRDKLTDAAYIGPSDIKIEDGKMTPEVLLSFGRLSDPQLSPDGNTILYGVSYTSVADNRTCRNLFICNTDGSEKHQITRSGSSISNARWSSDGREIYFLKGGQLYKAALMGKNGKNHRLGTQYQLSNVSGGINEFSISPDGTKIMFSSMVKGRVEVPKDSDPALDKADAYSTEDLMYRHWDHWVTDIPHTYVADFPNGDNLLSKDNSIDILGGPEVKYELPIEPFGGLEQLSWSPDSKRIAYSCKKQTGKEYAFSTDTEIYIFDIASGATSVIPMGGGYDTDPVWSPDGSKIAWLSMSRNGYEADKTRIMIADIVDGEIKEGVSPVGEIRDLTAQFKYNAAGLVWTSDSQHLYFNALAEGIQGIFKVYTGESSKIERLTADNLWYDFNSPFAVMKDGTLLASYCSLDFPTELVAVKGPEDITPITNENEHILKQLKPVTCEKRLVRTVDGMDMLTWVLYPPEFDSTKVYPAIEICLGGPQGTLSQGWSYRWNYRLMASQGYIVAMPNRRGTTAFGQMWTEQISGDYVGLNMQDYLSAAKELKSEPYVGKLAACGASYGGFSVYYLAGIHGNVYDCFIAHAGIFDEKYMYYETEEMWFPNWDNGGLSEYAYTPGEIGSRGDGVTFGGMKQGGSPWSSNPKAIRHYANSPAVNVTSWHTPILCIHGAMDFRIPYDQGMAAFNAAQMMGVPSKLIVFPDECHWILKPQNAIYWHRNYFEWLDRWCKE